jgi:hypothetical protein
LKIFGLKDSVDYDVRTKPIKLVIDNKDRLTRTMNVAGALLHHKNVIKIIRKNKLNALTEFIRQDIYTFIIKRGMILWKMLPDLKIKSSKMPLTEKISSSGKRILSNPLVGLPDEIRKGWN